MTLCETISRLFHTLYQIDFLMIWFISTLNEFFEAPRDETFSHRVAHCSKDCFQHFLNLTDDFFTSGSFTHEAYLAAPSQCAICDDLAAIKKMAILRAVSLLKRHLHEHYFPPKKEAWLLFFMTFSLMFTVEFPLLVTKVASSRKIIGTIKWIFEKNVKVLGAVKRCL